MNIPETIVYNYSSEWTWTSLNECHSNE